MLEYLFLFIIMLIIFVIGIGFGMAIVNPCDDTPAKSCAFCEFSCMKDELLCCTKVRDLLKGDPTPCWRTRPDCLGKWFKKREPIGDRK